MEYAIILLQNSSTFFSTELHAFLFSELLHTETDETEDYKKNIYISTEYKYWTLIPYI